MVNSFIAAEDLATELTVVRNEFEMGENNPGSVLRREDHVAAPTSGTTTASPPSASAATSSGCRSTTCRPSTGGSISPTTRMLVVAGKFDEAQAARAGRQHFGALPRPSRKLNKTWTEEPVQDGERSVALRRVGDVAVVAAAYHGVAGADPDWLALDAAAGRVDKQARRASVQGAGRKRPGQRGVRLRLSHRRAGPDLPGRQSAPGRRARRKCATSWSGRRRPATRRPVTDAEMQRWRARSQREFELALTDTARSAWRCRTGPRWAIGACSSSPAIACRPPRPPM